MFDPMRTIRPAVRSLGYRNLAYLGFVASLFPLALLADVLAHDPEDGGGLGLALALWAAVSIAFFLTNSTLAIVAAMRGRSIRAASIACCLPVLCLVAARLGIWL